MCCSICRQFHRVVEKKLLLLQSGVSVFLCLCTVITFELTFAHVDSCVSQLCMCSYLQNNISRDIAIVSAGQAAGGQDEFQIFDKHVKARTCNYANFTLTVVGVGGLIFAQKCSEAGS